MSCESRQKTIPELPKKALKGSEKQAGLSCLLRTACSIAQNNEHGNSNEGKSALEIWPKNWESADGSLKK